MTTVLNAMERSEKVRKVRRDGYVPACIYGPEMKGNLDIQIAEKEAGHFFKSHSIGARTKVKVNEKELNCMIKNIQYDPISGTPVHLDLYASSEESVVKTKIPFKFRGKSQLMRNGLVLNIVEDEIELQGMLKNLPEVVEVNVSAMEEGNVITLADIHLPEGIRALIKEDEVVASALKSFAPKQEEETE